MGINGNAGSPVSAQSGHLLGDIWVQVTYNYKLRAGNIWILKY